MRLKNLDVRVLMEEKRVKGYEVAAVMGISEVSFSRMLCRSEMNEEKKKCVILAIQSISTTNEEV